MNKMARSFFHALVLASLLSSLVVTWGSAAPAAQAVSGDQAVVRFDELGQTDTLLRGPYGTENIRFGLPANWSFDKGASLDMIVTTNVITNASQTIT